MPAMEWFRLYHEARNDAKLRTLDDSQHRVWFSLLCFSAEQAARGAVPAGDMELLAVEVAGGDGALLETTVERLIKLRILAREGDTLRFLHFEDRQYDKPSDHPVETRRRKAEQRERERDNNNGHDASRDVTPVTLCHATEAEAEADSEASCALAPDERFTAGFIESLPITERAKVRQLRANFSLSPARIEYAFEENRRRGNGPKPAKFLAAIAGDMPTTYLPASSTSASSVTEDGFVIMPDGKRLPTLEALRKRHDGHQPVPMPAEVRAQLDALRAHNRLQ